MASSFDKILGALTSTKGAALAAPVVLGTAFLLSLGGEPGPTPAVAQAGTQGAIQVAQAQAKDQGTQVNTEPKSAAQSDAAATFTPAQEKAIGEIVRKYLLANPDVLVDVSRELEKRQQAEKAEQQLKLISSQKKEIFQSPIDYVAGNPDGDVTVVEYFDYNCGWCKRALKEVAALVEQDKNVRVVMKEFPIFGEHSEFAAKAAMAAKEQGKYWDLHVALMKTKRVTKDNVLPIAESVGLDIEKLKADMQKPQYQAALQRNMAIAQSLGIQGTPGFIIDSEISPGYLPVANLKQKVSQVRKDGCQIC